VHLVGFIIRLNVSLYSSPVLVRRGKKFLLVKEGQQIFYYIWKVILLLLMDIGASACQLHVGIPWDTWLRQLLLLKLVCGV